MESQEQNQQPEQDTKALKIASDKMSAIISERAKTRLNNDIDILAKALRDSPIRASYQSANMEYENDSLLPRLSNGGPKLKMKDTGGTEREHNLFFIGGTSSSGSVSSVIYKELLPYYIHRETKEFFEKVDSLQEQIDNLTSREQEY